MQKAIAEHGDLIGPTYNTQYVDQSSGETKTQKEPAQNGAVLIHAQLRHSIYYIILSRF